MIMMKKKMKVKMYVDDDDNEMKYHKLYTSE